MGVKQEAEYIEPIIKAAYHSFPSDAGELRRNRVQLKRSNTKSAYIPGLLQLKAQKAGVLYLHIEFSENEAENPYSVYVAAQAIYPKPHATCLLPGQYLNGDQQAGTELTATLFTAARSHSGIFGILDSLYEPPEPQKVNAQERQVNNAQKKKDKSEQVLTLVSKETKGACTIQ